MYIINLNSFDNLRYNHGYIFTRLYEIVVLWPNEDVVYIARKVLFASSLRIVTISLSYSRAHTHTYSVGFTDKKGRLRRCDSSGSPLEVGVPVGAWSRVVAVSTSYRGLYRRYASYRSKGGCRCLVRLRRRRNRGSSRAIAWWNSSSSDVTRSFCPGDEEEGGDEVLGEINNVMSSIKY